MATRGRNGLLTATFLFIPLIAASASGLIFPGPLDAVDSIISIPRHALDPVLPNPGHDFSRPPKFNDDEDDSDGGGDDDEPGNDGGSNKGNDEPEPRQQGLKEDFYKDTCPHVEKIVKEVTDEIFHRDPRRAPPLVRLFFHDCFVTGCDASILLDETPSGEDVEKKAPHNGNFVSGYEVLDAIKTRLEEECPGVVSCADVLAFATRDALVLTGVPSYNVEAGRRDGLASLATNVPGNLSLPSSSAQDNIEIFERKGMTLEDLVLFTGAHSIGTAHCTVVARRFHDPQKFKDINHGYLVKMQSMTNCKSENETLPIDPVSQQRMDSGFYKQLLTKQALIEADQNLANDQRGNVIMRRLADDQEGWLAKFTESITRLGRVDVLTGDQGEVRRQCRAVN